MVLTNSLTSRLIILNQSAMFLAAVGLINPTCSVNDAFHTEQAWVHQYMEQRHHEAASTCNNVENCLE